MTKIKKYVTKLTNNLDYDKNTINELKMQFTDHILNIKNEYIKTGVNEKDSINLSIRDFGESYNSTNDFQQRRFHINKYLKKIMYLIFILNILLIVFAFLSPLTNEAISVQSKRSSFFIPYGHLATIQLLPFISIKEMLTPYSPSSYPPALISLLLFIPIGVTMPFITNKYMNSKYIIKTLLIFVLGIQLLRLIFPVGYVNIDIAILHFTGCLIGLGLYKVIFFNKLIKFTTN